MNAFLKNLSEKNRKNIMNFNITNLKNNAVQGFCKLAFSNLMISKFNLMLSKLTFSKLMLFKFKLALSLSFLAFCAAQSNLFAVDSVVVQTFTFDDIVTRQAQFKFPDASERFSKVIAKYRLKCDPSTTQDRFNCGEWDYLTYTKILRPTGEFRYSDRKHPKTTFGSFLLPVEGKTLTLTTTPVKDKFEKNNIRTTITASNTSQHILHSGNETNSLKPNYQFLVRAADLQNAGLTNNSQIGKITLEGNIVDTIENVIVRVARTSSSTLNDYLTGTFDTVAIQSLLTPEDCVNNKITINFMKNLVWNGTSNYCFEIISQPKPSTQNTFNGGSGGQAISAFPLSTLNLDEDNSWIDVDSMPRISGKTNFTFEGWLNISRRDSTTLDNAVIFSLGDKIVIRLVGRDANGFQIQTDMFDETGHSSRTSSRVMRFDTWTHIAVAFNGTSRTAQDRIRTFINGNSSTMDYSFWGNDGWAGSVAAWVDETPATFAIGRGMYYDVNDAQSNLKARIADVRVWDATLVASEISAWYRKKVDATHPKFSNLLLNYLFEDVYNSRKVTNSSNDFDFLHGKAIGNAFFSNQNFGLQYSERADFVPNITLESGDFEYQQSNVKYFVEKEQVPVSIVYYNTNPQISYPTIERIEYFYKPVITTFDVDGNVISEENSNATSSARIVGNELFDYRAKGSPIYREMEIGRFITPYGINLSLGENGFEWEYDFTDYMNELRGDVIIVAHNWQELIDLKFIFYRGEPVREVLRVNEHWGPRARYYYRDLVNDVSLKATTLDLLPETKSIKLKTRITGHGMVFQNAADTGLQCCEFYDNYHRILAGENLTQVARWKIWQDCDNNPVFPQGGTWIFAREGWCPGDIVYDYEYDLTPFIKDQKITIDYDISRTLFDAYSRTGGGDYRMNFHLVEYGSSIYQNDLELYKVISPSNADIFSRLNPICNGIKFIIRNNSNSDIRNFTLLVKNGTEEFSQIVNLTQLKQPLRPFTFDTVTIDIDNPDFWSATSETQPELIIELSLPNGEVDDNPSNNTVTQPFKLPDIYDKDNFVIRYRSNNYPSNYVLQIYNFAGNQVKTFTATAQNTTYNISLNDLPYGCYTFKFEALGHNYGLSFWGFPALGSGTFGLYDGSGRTLRVFNPDFGKHITYSFVLNSFTSIRENAELVLSVYPNPSSELLHIQAYEDVNDAVIDIFDINGNIVYKATKDITENNIITLNISKLVTGTYSVRIAKGNRIIWNKFIKN